MVRRNKSAAKIFSICVAFFQRVPLHGFGTKTCQQRDHR
jgi:hypothetical protein